MITVEIGSHVVVDVYTDGETHRTVAVDGVVVAIDGDDVTIDTPDGGALVLSMESVRQGWT
jgi:transcription elongation GreA/GreB family factor